MNFREVRTLRLKEDRRPNENDIWEAWQYANEKCCVIEIQWVDPHYGIKTWTIEPENNIEDLLRNLNIK